jgi:hypothetical protein
MVMVFVRLENNNSIFWFSKNNKKMDVWSYKIFFYYSFGIIKKLKTKVDTYLQLKHVITRKDNTIQW